jgi:predicted negative regulator of RcsB-dependent stress response
MLVGGIILFVFAVYFVITGRSFKVVVLLFGIAIIMLAYPKITSFKLPGGIEVQLVHEIKAVQQNPNDPTAKARLAATLAQANQDPNITPETRLTLANAQLLLGRRDEATTNVKAALKAQPNLKLESHLRALVPTSNPSG